MKKNKTFMKESLVVSFLVLIICFSVFFLFPVFNKELVSWELNDPLFDSNSSLAERTVPMEIIDSDGSLAKRTVPMEIKLETGDMLLVTVAARNLSSIDYPVATTSVKWRTTDEGNTAFKSLNLEKFQIFVDGLKHTYHINIGENPYWQINDSLAELKIELPHVNGIDFEIQKLSFKKRLFPPFDSYINRFFRNNFQIRQINRFLIPAYILIILLCFFTFSLKFVSKKVLTGKIIFFFSAVILVIFSFYYLKNEIFTIKSYYDSFRKNILSKNLKNTYLGFYDFRKFISWLDDNTPDDAGIIVLIKGEQIYIMSELVYNLYPKDIVFLNISGKNTDNIISDIDQVLKSREQRYSYLVVLSEDDFSGTGSSEDKDIEETLKTKLIFEKKYRKTGGFLYRIFY